MQITPPSNLADTASELVLGAPYIPYTVADKVSLIRQLLCFLLELLLTLNSTRRSQSAVTATFQVECDLARLSEATKHEDLTSFMSAELPLCPNSAPSAMVTTAPCHFEPGDAYRLSEFSSFPPPAFSSPQLKRRRAKKDIRLQEVAKLARSDSAVLESTPFAVAAASLPLHPRAGLAGVELKLKNVTLRPKSKIARPTSAPSPSRNLALPVTPRTPLAPVEGSLSLSIPSSSFYSTPIKPGTKPPASRTPSPSFPISPPTSPASPSPPSVDTELQRRASVEDNLIRNHPQLAGFTFAHRSGLAGQSTTFVDASRRAFATRVECPSGMLGVAEELEKEVSASTVPPMKSDGSRGMHQIRQIGVHRETGAVEPVYSSAFTASPTKWISLMCGKAFGRIRGHVSRT